MNDVLNINKLADRKTKKIRKRDAKKREIADSAISALKTFGYARTTLRDVAAQSGMSLGSLHYYFEDKDDLLIYCVRQYKSDFVETVTAAVDGFSDPQDVTRAFCRTLAETLHTNAEIHRLWYDIRNQAMFDETFVPAVLEIEGKLIGMMQSLTTDPEEQELLYVRLDGAFRYLLQQQLTGHKLGVEKLQAFFLSATR